MARLQDLLGQSVTQTLGLREIIEGAERRGIQERQVIERQAERDANERIREAQFAAQDRAIQAQENIAKTQAESRIATTAISGVGTAASAFFTAEAKKTTDIAKQKITTNLELLKAGFIPAKSGEEGAQQLGDSNIFFKKNLFGTKNQKDALEIQNKTQDLKNKVQQGTLSANQGVQSLRKEFQANTIIKSTNIVNQNMNRMNAAWNDYLALTPQEQEEKGFVALDQALVVVFNKTLDPPSVVRESEFNRTGAAQGVFDQIQGFIEKVKKGGTGLSRQNRQEIVDTMNQLARGQNALAASVYNFYNQEAEFFTPDTNRIVGSFPIPDFASEFYTPPETNTTPQSEVDRLQQGIQQTPTTPTQQGPVGQNPTGNVGVSSIPADQVEEAKRFVIANPTDPQAIQIKTILNSQGVTF